jgi:hypothetical protein
VITIVPATQAMCSSRGLLPNPTVRAVAAIDGDKVLGIGGVYLDGTRLWLFAEVEKEAWQDRRAVVKAYRAVLAFGRGLHMPIHAIPEEGNPQAVALLEHMGFKPIRPAPVYEWRGT